MTVCLVIFTLIGFWFSLLHLRIYTIIKNLSTMWFSHQSMDVAFKLHLYSVPPLPESPWYNIGDSSTAVLARMRIAMSINSSKSLSLNSWIYIDQAMLRLPIVFHLHGSREIFWDVLHRVDRVPGFPSSRPKLGPPPPRPHQQASVAPPTHGVQEGGKLACGGGGGGDSIPTKGNGTIKSTVVFLPRWSPSFTQLESIL